MLLNLSQWIDVHDGDPDAFAIMSRHYSFRKYADGRRQQLSNPNRRLFCGPGEKMVLITPDKLALFVWRNFHNQYRPQGGLNCAVFRNEGSTRSSQLILAAERRALERWPEAGFYTYVNPAKVRSTNPGYCFLKAGWKHAGTTKGGLLILEK